MTDPVHTLRDDRVGIIELARPEKYNCLSMQAWTAIDTARRAFEANDTVRAILIRSRGEHFCTGADLDEVKTLRHDLEKTQAFTDLGHGALLALESSPLPVIAAVQGLCLAGGLELMLGADIVFASKSARIGDQHAQYGLIPGWGGSQRLPRLLGQRRALDLMFSAQWLSAEEALAIGLVNYICDDEDLWTEAMAYAQNLSRRSRQGLAEMKRLVRAGSDCDREAAMSLEAQAAARHIIGPDTAEGLAAFEARRKPEFG